MIHTNPPRKRHNPSDNYTGGTPGVLVAGQGRPAELVEHLRGEAVGGIVLGHRSRSIWMGGGKRLVTPLRCLTAVPVTMTSAPYEWRADSNRS